MNDSTSNAVRKPRPIRGPGLLVLVCAVLVLPARFLGEVVALIWRAAIDRLISGWDRLFEFVTERPGAAHLAHQVEAWGAWLAHGLTSGFVAMSITRFAMRRRARTYEIAVVVGIWGLVRSIWNWDAELRFALGEPRIGGPAVAFGPWPVAPWLGFLAGLGSGLALASLSWPARRTPQPGAGVTR